jgi:beta-lactamase regulating signal transducer with metallopeptidase domain
MTAWLADALLGSALLLAFVLLIRVPVRRVFGARIAYALWVLPALRLLLPPLPAMPVEAAPVTLGRETIVVLVTAPEVAPAFPITTVLLAIWAAGAATVLAWEVVRYRRFTRAVLASAEDHGTADSIRVVLSDLATGPLAFGLLRRTVALPRDWAAAYHPDERAMALAHEVAHHRRGDLLAAAAALVVLACHWFNPLAWAAARAFRVDQELAADAHVLARHDPALRGAYASAILKAACGRTPRTVACLRSVRDLKGRMIMLTRTPASHRRLAVGSAAVSALVLGGLVATASGASARATVEQAVAATGAAIAAQVRHAPPAPAVPPIPATAPRKAKRVVIINDGKTRTLEEIEAEAFPAENSPPVPPAPPSPESPPAPPAPPSLPIAAADVTRISAEAIRTMPRIVSADCRPGQNGAQTVVTRRSGDKRTIVICTNRIESRVRLASLAAVDARRVSGLAMRNALESLRRARETIASERMAQQLTPEQRSNALKGIDSSIAEMERESGDR